jgi:tRNA-specific 2-thiouridylase
VGVDPRNGEAALLRGIDHKKDQSYVLFGMSRRNARAHAAAHRRLRKARRARDRRRAEAAGFQQADSQEICFVPNQDYAAS